MPCHHALHFISKLRAEGAEIENFVDECFSVAKFCATYAENVPPLTDLNDWEVVNPGFNLEPPILRRPPGRPKKKIIEASHENVPRLGKSKFVIGLVQRINEVEDVQRVDEVQEVQRVDGVEVLP